jgi:uncharacterized membrane protein YfcA
VTWPHALLLFAAGIGAGLSGSVAGLASLFSYPALLATGLAPVPATVTNTVALVFSTVGSVLGSRPELRVQNRRRLANLVATTLVGGLAGSLLQLFTPADTFERVVPVLIALAALAVLAPRPRAHATADGAVHPTADPAWLFPAAFGVSLYCGYFGAGSGTMLLALYLLATADTFAGCNAVKNLTLGTANAAAAVLFAVTAPVHWLSVLPLAAGTLIGGRIGPVVVRHAPVRPLRWVIALAGLGLAVQLGVHAYT